MSLQAVSRLPSFPDRAMRPGEVLAVARDARLAQSQPGAGEAHAMLPEAEGVPAKDTIE